MWSEMKRILGFNFPSATIVDISILWKNKKNVLINMVNAAILRIIWLTRNDMVFNRTQWFGMHVLWRKIAYNLAQWGILLKEEEKGNLMMMVNKLEILARMPPLLLWPEPG
jgi:hypothetical protein